MTKMCMGCMSEYEDEYEVCPKCGYIEGSHAEEALHMEPGSILRERYIVGKVLGFGGFGVTYLGWDTLLEQKVAIKEYLPSEFSTRMPGQTQVTVFNGDKKEQFGDGLSKFIEEAQRLVRFQSEEGIVKIFDSFEDNNTAYIIMEYLDGETLAKFLKREKRVSADKAIEMLLPVIKSLKAVHEQGIIHRDIAPDNIFLTSDGRVKLIDFGSARFATTSHSRSLTVIIKPGYSPEEQYRSRGDQGAHTDVYAIGATLYRMITGETPPDALERRAFFESKKKDILKPITKYIKDITENQETAILNALNVRIEDRTQNMENLEKELLTEDPEKVVRLYGKIKRIDILKWPLWAKITASAAMLTVITLSTLFITGVIGFDALLQTAIKVPDGMSRVPSIINDDLGKAENRLENADLLYMITGKTYSNLVPADLILTQSVSAGSVVINNTIVDVSVSGGAETKTVPDVIGLNIEEASEILEELGFAVQIEKEYSNLIAENGVVSQNKDPESELAVGETITLVVSMGQDPTKQDEQTLSVVPNLVGLKYQDAVKAAQEAGFVISIKSKEYSDKYDKDIVMSQSIKANTEVMTGNTIELIVSLGIQKAKVPDVQFKTEAEAREMISKSGFIVSIKYQNSETVAAGVVISQNPAPKTTLEIGKTVEIIVSSGGVAFPMPNVVGESEVSAKSILSGKGLSVSVEYEHSDTVAEGNVISQSVVPNTSVKRGKAVTITVSSGKELFNVANVVGKKKADATNTLTGQGFEVTAVEVYSETVASDIVISQSPQAGSSQARGTRIVITVSKGKEPIPIQNMTNKTLAVAKSTLESLGFKVTTTEAYSDSTPYVPAGSIISQNPSSGTAFKGSTIALVVSKGRTPVNLPNVVNQSKSAAQTALQNAGLKVNYAPEVYSSTVSAGNVISQSPAYGTSVYKGDTITLTVSKGPDPDAYTISLNKSSLSMQEDGTEQLLVTYNPSGTSAKTITWTSSNTSVATVSSSGLITAKAQGSATITAAAPNGKKATASVNVTALPKYTVSFNVNGGTGSAPAQTVKSGTAVTLPSVTKSFRITYNANSGNVSPTSKDLTCSFNGWYTSATGGTKRGNAGASYKPSASETLYAQWATVTYGTLPTPTRTNYTFDGWYTSATGGTKITTSSSVTSNTTIYAHWVRDSYTITFNANGGTAYYSDSDKREIITKTVYAGEEIVPPRAEKNKHCFFHKNLDCDDVLWDGNGHYTVEEATWYTSASGGTERCDIWNGYVPTKSETLYMHWDDSKFLVDLTKWEPPEITGYHFDGWYTSATGGTKLGNTVLLTSEYTHFYAHWTRETYTINFNSNGGSLSTASRSVNGGDSVALPTPTKSLTLTYNANGGNVSSSSKSLSFNCEGWYTSASGGSKRGNAGGSYVPTSSETLYAHWNNPSAGTLPTPTRSGYTFEGWYTSSSGGSQVTSSTTFSSSTTIYAHWTNVKLTSISVSAPSQREYYIGDGLNTSGMSVTAKYSDGSTKTVTSSCSVSGFSSSGAGTKTVTVSYSEGGVTATDSFTVSVNTPSISLSKSSYNNESDSYSISNGRCVIDVDSLPRATTYPASQSVTWTSSDTNKAYIDDGTIYFLEPGSVTFTAKMTYNGKTYTATYSCNVKWYCVTTANMYLRKGIGTSNGYYTMIPKGTKIYASEVSTYSADGYFWGKVSYGGYTGWGAFARVY